LYTLSGIFPIFLRKSLSILHFHAPGESKRIAVNLLKIERIAAVVRKTDKAGSESDDGKRVFF
jgi:hypothetical protein